MATAQLKRQSLHAEERTQSVAPTPRTLPIAVFLGHQNITSHYVARLREEITLDRHRTFLQTKYGWSCPIRESIAWHSFHLCAQRTRLINATNRSKLVHNWLNLGHQRATMAPSSADKACMCPYCSLPEDFVHLLSCKAPRAMKFRYDATEDLRKSLGSNVVDTTILRVLKQWMETPNDHLVVPELLLSTESALETAISSQAAIGWTNLFRGFVSSAWGFIYKAEDNCPVSADNHSKAINHLALVIRALQDYSLAIWKSRNEVLHENSAQSCVIVHAKLHQDISRLYSLQASYSPILQSYFALPLQDRLLRPLRHKQRWLRLATLATSHFSSQGSRQQLVTTYFPYAPTTTTVRVTCHTVELPNALVPGSASPSLHQVPITTLLPPRAVPTIDCL